MIKLNLHTVGSKSMLIKQNCEMLPLTEYNYKAMSKYQLIIGAKIYI